MLRGTLLAAILSLAGVSTAAAAGPCKDISTVWTINAVYVDKVTATRIYSDGSPYTDGSSGVTAAIKVCAGTDDAVLSMSSGRSVLFNFTGAALDPSPVPPAWTSSGAFATPSAGNKKPCSGSPCTVLNVRNILDSG